VSRRITLAWLSDAASIAVAYPTRRKLGEFMPEAIRTRCKFRVVSVESVDHCVKSEAVNEGEPGFDDFSEYSQAVIEGKKVRYRQVAFAQNVRLAAQYDPDNKEDVSFSEATPSGECKIYVSNPAIVNSFVIGRSYYLDLIPCK
jgi:hypothetical protein